MKRSGIIFSLLVLTIIMAGCALEPSYELINVNAVISNDRNIVGAVGITEGKKKGQEQVPTELIYIFTLRNSGVLNAEIDLSDRLRMDGLEAIIEPKDKLKGTLEKTVGINIFDPDGYTATGLGYGSCLSLVLKRGEDAESSLSYDLGVNEKSPNATLIVPSDQELDEILNNAFDADLVILNKGHEIERFDLSKVTNAYSEKQRKAIANSIEFINGSDFAIRDKIDTSKVKIKQATDDTWEAVRDVKGLPIAKDEMNVMDWIITVGDPSFQWHSIVICDNDTANVIGFIPLD